MFPPHHGLNVGAAYSKGKRVRFIVIRSRLLSTLLAHGLHFWFPVMIGHKTDQGHALCTAGGYRACVTADSQFIQLYIPKWLKIPIVQTLPSKRKRLRYSACWLRCPPPQNANPTFKPYCGEGSWPPWRLSDFTQVGVWNWPSRTAFSFCNAGIVFEGNPFRAERARQLSPLPNSPCLTCTLYSATFVSFTVQPCLISSRLQRTNTNNNIVYWWYTLWPNDQNSLQLRSSKVDQFETPVCRNQPTRTDVKCSLRITAWMWELHTRKKESDYALDFSQLVIDTSHPWTVRLTPSHDRTQNWSRPCTLYCGRISRLRHSGLSKASSCASRNGKKYSYCTDVDLWGVNGWYMEHCWLKCPLIENANPTYKPYCEDDSWLSWRLSDFTQVGVWNWPCRTAFSFRNSCIVFEGNLFRAESARQSSPHPSSPCLTCPALYSAQVVSSTVQPRFPLGRNAQT